MAVTHKRSGDGGHGEPGAAGPGLGLGERDESGEGSKRGKKQSVGVVSLTSECEQTYGLNGVFLLMI